jgi:hypothetical protein
MVQVWAASVGAVGCCESLPNAQRAQTQPEAINNPFRISSLRFTKIRCEFFITAPIPSY